MAIVLALLSALVVTLVRRVRSRTPLLAVSAITWLITALFLLGWGTSYAQRLSYQIKSNSGQPDTVFPEGYDAAHNRALRYWLDLKAQPGNSYSFRFTWILSYEGTRLESAADRAIADAIAQLGRPLEAWEIETITDYFVDPHVESGVELLLVLPLLGASYYAARALRSRKELTPHPTTGPPPSA